MCLSYVYYVFGVSSLVVVKKPQGLDLALISKVLIPGKCPLLIIDELVLKLTCAKFFSKIDLK